MNYLTSLIHVILVVVMLGGCSGQLTTTFYDSTCSNVTAVVRNVVESAQRGDVRAGAKLIRIHFHDCFVNGCDGSILLDNAAGIESEKDARPNAGVLGYDIVDDIKTAIESVCPGVVSCADILALASQISVSLTGGPSYEVPLGRRDSRAANRAEANTDLPGPFSTLANLTTSFSRKNLDATDLVALSGAHTFGRARCGAFSGRLYNFQGTGGPDPSIDPTYLETLRQTCPQGGNANALENLDQSTPDAFDNAYFVNLQNGRGLLLSDQVLNGTGPTARFAGSQTEFFDAFVQSMIKMGDIRPPSGIENEIRTDCKRLN